MRRGSKKDSSYLNLLSCATHRQRTLDTLFSKLQPHGPMPENNKQYLFERLGQNNGQGSCRIRVLATFKIQTFHFEPTLPTPLLPHHRHFLEQATQSAILSCVHSTTADDLHSSHDLMIVGNKAICHLTGHVVWDTKENLCARFARPFNLSFQHCSKT